MSLSFLLIFSATVFSVSIIPGPSMLLALSHGMQHGLSKTLISAVGNVSVTILQAVISMAGLGAILASSELFFQLIKWAGAAYLIYIGISLLLAKKESLTLPDTEQTTSATSNTKLFLQSALITVGNPKAIIFFTAVFPQFIDPNIHYLVQSSILIGLCAVIAFICFMLYGMIGHKLVALFAEAKIRQRINQLIGGGFISAGIGLASSNR